MRSVARASTEWPISRHGTEYSAVPTLMWQSGPTFGVDQVANSNGDRGKGTSAAASAAVNTASGAAPSMPRCARWPATSVHQRTAVACMSGSLAKSRPRQKLSRT
jgi:hypothetical protein